MEWVGTILAYAMFFGGIALAGSERRRRHAVEESQTPHHAGREPQKVASRQARRHLLELSHFSLSSATATCR